MREGYEIHYSLTLFKKQANFGLKKTSASGPKWSVMGTKWSVMGPKWNIMWPKWSVMGPKWRLKDLFSHKTARTFYLAMVRE
jgi:hypothetical protein